MYLYAYMCSSCEYVYQVHTCCHFSVTLSRNIVILEILNLSIGIHMFQFVHFYGMNSQSFCLLLAITTQIVNLFLLALHSIAYYLPVDHLISADKWLLGNSSLNGSVLKRK